MLQHTNREEFMKPFFFKKAEMLKFHERVEISQIEPKIAFWRSNFSKSTLEDRQ